MTSEQFFNGVWTLTVSIVQLLVAVTPIIAVLIPLLIPLIGGYIKDKKHREAFATVTRMGMLATNVAAEELSKGMQAAMDPTSPGGVVITKEEMAAVMGKAALAAIRWAQDQKVLKTVVSVYGGEEAVKQSLIAIINEKLSGSPVGAAVRARINAVTATVDAGPPWNFQPAPQAATAEPAPAALPAAQPDQPALPPQTQPAVVLIPPPAPVQPVPSLAAVAAKQWNFTAEKK